MAKTGRNVLVVLLIFAVMGPPAVWLAAKWPIFFGERMLCRVKNIPTKHGVWTMLYVVDGGHRPRWGVTRLSDDRCGDDYLCVEMPDETIVINGQAISCSKEDGVIWSVGPDGRLYRTDADLREIADICGQGRPEELSESLADALRPWLEE